jgi:RNA polymerase sigma-70 factor, ECF subfamily
MDGKTGEESIQEGLGAEHTGGMAGSLQNQSDAALVIAIGRLRQDALAEVYRRHAGALYGLGRRILGESSLSEEMVQEVFLRLWNEPERFDPERGSLRSFLLAQAHGRAVDVLRSDTSRRRREERDARRSAESGYDIEHEVWDLAVAEQVKGAMAELPEDERKAIELAYFGGHTYQEVAVALGAPEGTVKSRIRAGLRRLRAMLPDVGIGAAWSY